jgi:hypothetical protein
LYKTYCIIHIALYNKKCYNTTIKLKNIVMSDYYLKEAVSKVLTMIRDDFKHRVGLAIYLVSEEYDISMSAISYELHKIRFLKKKKTKYVNWFS